MPSATGPRAPEGFFENERWISGAAGQRVATAMESRLSARFGVDTKRTAEQRLRRGLIGTIADHDARQLVVVVDPAKADMAALRSDLTRTAAATRRQTPNAPVPGVRVQAGCHDAGELAAAADMIRARDWHPRAEAAGFTSSLDPYTSTYEVEFAPEDREVGEALKARLGALVDVGYSGAPRPTDRADDGEPHWGGAGIGVDGDGRGNVCSSGFTVDTRSAGKAMVTAGHCFRNGDRIESGNEPYGVAQRESGYPTWDMMLINASSQNYNDDVYHNPYRAEHNPIDVSSGGNPSVGTRLCISGMRSLALCGNVVRSVHADFCPPNRACTPEVMRTVRDGRDPCIGGDSGAPMYRRSAPTRIHGMLIGATVNANDTSIACWGEKVSSIRAHLEVGVATSP